ncbi:hypothetical protein QJQ45_002724 [Haematococcus lacustris]|nr:hypothetical protein QJQ45_002724 [Haematococcus lacustris]
MGACSSKSERESDRRYEVQVRSALARSCPLHVGYDNLILDLAMDYASKLQGPSASQNGSEEEELKQPTMSQARLEPVGPAKPQPQVPKPKPILPDNPALISLLPHPLRPSLDTLVQAGLSVTRAPLHVVYCEPSQLVKDVHDLVFVGQGSQGVVYEGVWQGATVAVKWSIADNLDAGAYELLFSRLLSHPNVVQTYDAKVAVLDDEVFSRPSPGGGPIALTAGLLSASTNQLGSNDEAGPPKTSTSGDDSSKESCSNPMQPAQLSPSQQSQSAGGQAVPQGAQQLATKGQSQRNKLRRGHSAALGREASPTWRGSALGPKAAAAPAAVRPSTVTGAAINAATAASILRRSSSFQSEEGFGDPLGRPSNLGDIRDMLHLIGAKPKQHITQMIMVGSLQGLVRCQVGKRQDDRGALSCNALAQEFCDQGSLLTAIGRGIFLPNGRFGPKVALRALYRTAREVAQGMFHLHSANVIHGDLKPANVLLMNSRKDRRGFVARVSDFGLAQYCPAAGQVLNAPWGTLVFMAPERFKGNILSTASDVWSFGVILWQMYTAQLPYQGAKQAELMKGIINGSLTLTWPSGAPPPLVAFAGRCMSYNASERPSFEALMHELALMESEVRMDGVRLSFSTETARPEPHPTRSAGPSFSTPPHAPGPAPLPAATTLAPVAAATAARAMLQGPSPYTAAVPEALPPSSARLAGAGAGGAAADFASRPQPSAAWATAANPLVTTAGIVSAAAPFPNPTP